MRNSSSTVIILILVGIIAFLSWKLLNGAEPLPLAPAPVATSTQPKPTPTPAPDPKAPLSLRVTVEMPAKHATVQQSFAVSGKAPGPWYFEASFPIQIRDAGNEIIGRSHGQAQGDWMTTALVPFTATVTLDVPYHGPADLILLRDNPSGLPENDDSLTIPIVIQ